MIAVVFFILGIDIVNGHTYSINSRNFEVTKDSFSGPESRIYGGYKARDNQFPFLILLILFTNYRLVICNGSLIKPYWVLTAAQCFNEVIIKPEDAVLAGGKADLEDYMYLRLRTHKAETVNEDMCGVQERRAAVIYIHPRFDFETLSNDVAVIELKMPFNSTSIKPIPISKKRMRKPMQCIILSWGIMPNENYRVFELYYTKKIAKTTDMGCMMKASGPFICIYRGSRGICEGDFGSPLICDEKIYGVASIIYYKTDKNRSCGSSFEDFYTEIFRHFRWINHPSGGSHLTCTNILFLTGFIFFKFVLYL